MANIRRQTIVRSLNALVQTLRFGEARELAAFYRNLFPSDAGLLRDISRIEIEIELNDGDVDLAVSKLYTRVFDEYSTESAKVLIDHCWRTQRTDESERICAFVQEKLHEAAERTEPSPERTRLDAGRRYFLGRQLQFATINGSDQKEIQRIKTELEIYPTTTMGSWDVISTIENGSTIDPASVTRDKWHRTEEIQFYPLNFPPSLPFGDAIRNLILPGQPSQKIRIAKSDTVLTYGSCFAANLRNGLHNRGFSAESFSVPEGLNNSFALLNYFKWALEGNSIGDGAYDRTKSGSIEKWGYRNSDAKHLQALKRAKLLVITFGLSEIWYDKETRDVFWRGVPEKEFSESRHAFRVSTVEETKKNINEMLTVLRSHLGNKPFFLTLSPIPLQATFANQNCVVADAQSKSVIRAALGEVLREREDNNTIYWPAFEMIRWLGSHLSYPTLHEGDSRHPDRSIVDDIIAAFCDMYLDIADIEPQSLKARDVVS